MFSDTWDMLAGSLAVKLATHNQMKDWDRD